METNRHQPMDREPAEGPRFEDSPPGRDKRREEEAEREQPEGRASRGTTTKESVEAAWTPPREESREKDINPHRPRRHTL
jgi:hypothetical protein